MNIHLLVTQLCLLVVIISSIITYCSLHKTIISLMGAIASVSKSLDAVINYLILETGDNLPTHCFSCGVILQGGATIHRKGCTVLTLIEKHFPKEQPYGH